MRAPPLDLRLLEMFEAVFVEKSLTNAAVKLALSQPAVSQGLGRLRAHFGDPLFVRMVGGMEPTPRAKELFSSVSVILREARASLVAKPVFNAATDTREFVVATTDLGAAALIPGLIDAVRTRAPQVRIASVSAGGRDLAGGMAAGDVDLAIGNFPMLQAGFYQQSLYQETYVLLADPARAGGESELTLEEFRSAQHVLVTTGSSGHFHGEIERRLRALIPPENIVATLSSFIVAPLVARNSNVLVTVPSRVARIYADLFGLEQLALPLDLPAYPITQYWHARYHHDPGLVWLRRLLHELYSAGGEAHAELTPDDQATEYQE